MSKLVFKKPIEHLPGLTEYQLDMAGLNVRLQPLGLENIYLWDYTYRLFYWKRVMS